MKDDVKEKNFSILYVFKTMFSNEEIEDEKDLEKELEEIKKQENKKNIQSLEKMVKSETTKRGRKPKYEVKAEDMKKVKIEDKKERNKEKEDKELSR